jgi:hypothetical protein
MLSFIMLTVVILSAIMKNIVTRYAERRSVK